MVDFGSLGKMAQKQFGGGGGGSGSEDQKGTTASGEGWSGVGRSAKDTFTEAQAGRASGKDVDYAKIGGLAKQAAAEYNREGGDKDLNSIGRQVASGMFGSGGNGAGNGASSSMGNGGTTSSMGNGTSSGLGSVAAADEMAPAPATTTGMMQGSGGGSMTQQQ